MSKKDVKDLTVSNIKVIYFFKIVLNIPTASKWVEILNLK